VGRLIAVVLFIALMVPAALLFRAWGLASGRRQVAGAAVEFATPTQAGSTYLIRQATHGRRVRRLGLMLGVVAVVVSVVLFAEASVFLWLPAVGAGLLLGVLLAEATRPRPRWGVGTPPRRPRQGEQVSPWLLWTMRAAVADVPVDEAQRTWTAHLVVAAASVLALLPLGSLLLVAGIGLGDEVSGEGAGLVPVALVAGGFSALAAGLAVAGYLLSWLRPVRHTSPALAG
jgi:hypothetical protein